MRIKKDSSIRLNDYSRWVIDIIVKIESKIDTEYRARLQKKNNYITTL
jgi:hypothetical protein